MRPDSLSGKYRIAVRGVAMALSLLLAACAVTPGPPPVTTLTAPAGATVPQPTTHLAPTPEEDLFLQDRLAMVEDTIEMRGVRNPDVLRVMRTVPRHKFVLPQYLNDAYADHPLPIGYGQTISQPYIVAWMTELLDLKPGEKVLEIGTGSGYQAAVLAELGYVDVYSIEIVPELAESAAARLRDLGYTQIYLLQGDGYYGWPERAPFDAIIVTAAPDHLPQPLADQLKEGGRLVIPIGLPGGYQTLWQFAKEGGELKAYNLGSVAFVPLTGAETGLQPSAEPAP